MTLWEEEHYQDFLDYGNPWQADAKECEICGGKYIIETYDEHGNSVFEDCPGRH